MMSLLKKTALPQPSMTDERSTVARFLEEHEMLNQRVMLLEDENKAIKIDCASMENEIKMLRAELERSDKARLTLQAVSVGLITRLSVIKETIDVAVREAAQHRIEPEGKRDPAAEKKEQDEARQLVENLANAVERDIVAEKRRIEKTA